MKENAFEQWVIIVRNSASHTFQILDESLQRMPPATKWSDTVVGKVIAFGLRLYGITLPP